MKQTNIFAAIAVLILLSAGTSSCSSQEFTIVGKWGMVSGSITDSNGSTNRYGELSNGSYYQILEYKIDGTYIRTSFPSKDVSYGTYTYNDSNHDLKYKLDGDKYYTPATITIHSANQMTIFTDWGSVGSMTQYMKKI